MVDLKKAPFHLNPDQIKWVKESIDKMTLEEKVGQLLFTIGFTTKEKDLEDLLTNFHPGGMMYRTSKANKVISAHRFVQSHTNIPLLLAANLEAGGNGIIDEGTNYGTNMQVGASNKKENAYMLGKIATTEGAMVGCNMAFAPVIDINMNFRNPITNTRSFGDRIQLVTEMSAEYVKAAEDNQFSVTIKHFPGDGTDGRDHHLLTSNNLLSYKDWMNSYGKVYKACIQENATGLMVGHITLKGYFDAHPEVDQSYKEEPATLNPVLLNNLLRKELHFNGLTMTDASLMAGFGSRGKRKDLVVKTIASGCDMLLFNRNVKEDFESLKAGVMDGRISEERLEEALSRILGLKAKLNLHKKSLDELVPATLDVNQLAKHQELAKKLADESVTLVKDTAHLLPITPEKYKRIGILYFGNLSSMEVVFNSTPRFKGFMLKLLLKLQKHQMTVPEQFVSLLKEKGFDAFEYSFGDIFTIMKESNQPIDSWARQFDLMIVLTKIDAMSNQTSLSLTYKAMGFDAPWFIKEIPTMHISVSNPYQVYDLPMIDTVINGYTPKTDVYQAIVDKMTGSSSFKGKSPISFDFKESIHYEE